MRLTKAQRLVADRKIAVLRLRAAKRVSQIEETIVSEAKNHTLYHLIERDVKELWINFQERLSAGLTIAGVWQLLQDATESFMKILDRVEADGQDKKEIVILLVEDFYKEEIKDLDLPWVPNTIEGFVDTIIGDAIRPTMSWLIDKIKGR